MPPLPPLTQALMLACTAAYFGGLLLRNSIPLEYWFALWPIGTGLFRPWQLLTYAFLHGSFTHLLFNMLGLWMFGSELERLWGRRRYGEFLIAGALTAALAQLVFTAIAGSPAPTVGASGALYALLLAYGMLFPNRTVMLLIPPIPMKARTFVIVFGTLELLFGLSGSSGIAHFAHLGGMLGGWLMIRWWRGQPPFGRARRR